MIPRIENYDYFYQWRDKTNAIATLLGDIELINVSSTDRDSFVEAVNKVISNIGALATLTTTVKTSIVNAINEHQTKIGSATLTTTGQTVTEAINELDNEMGDLTTLKTTTKSSSVNAINEIFDSLLVDSAAFSIGSESSDIIRVTVQLKDKSGTNLAIPVRVGAYLSDNSDGSTLAATAPSGGWAIGTSGILLPLVAGKVADFVCTSSGVFNVDITETAAKTFYLVVAMPLGNLKISSAITFA